MNRYEVALDIVKSAVKEVNPNQTQLRKAHHSIQQLKEACDKADKYDLFMEKLTDRHLSTDQEVEEWGEFYIKQDVAKEIIEMLEEEISYCKKEKKLALRQNQELSNEFDSIWCSLNTQVEKIKERYGIK